MIAQCLVSLNELAVPFVKVDISNRMNQYT